MRLIHEQVVRALQDAGMRRVYHLTYAAQLPDIAASGGLLAPALREATPRHSWGANADLGLGRICLSRRVSRQMIGRRMNGHEIALLVIDTRRIPDLSHAWVTPGNSGAHAARPYMDDRADILGTLHMLARDKSAYPEAELLLSDGIPLSTFRSVIFSDDRARAVWWPACVSGAPVGMELPDATIAARAIPGGFPSWYVAGRRERPTGAGVDQLAAGYRRPWPDAVIAAVEQEPHWMDADDWDALEEDDGPPAWADFYDDGEPDDPGWYEPSLRD